MDSIPYGEDFRVFLQNEVRHCQVFLAVIGNRWIHAVDKNGRRRIDNPADFVRIEIESALNAGIAMIPVLIGRTNMPSPSELPSTMENLAFRNATRVDTGRDFHHHVDILIRKIEKTFSRRTKESRFPQHKKRSQNLRKDGQSHPSAGTSLESTGDTQLDLKLALTPKPKRASLGDTIHWTVTIQNNSTEALTVLSYCDEKNLLDAPFELTPGERRHLNIEETYDSAGEITTTVTAIGLTHAGQSLRRETSATVRIVTPRSKSPSQVKRKPPGRRKRATPETSSDSASWRLKALRKQFPGLTKEELYWQYVDRYGTEILPPTLTSVHGMPSVAATRKKKARLKPVRERFPELTNEERLFLFNDRHGVSGQDRDTQGKNRDRKEKPKFNDPRFLALRAQFPSLTDEELLWQFEDRYG